MASPSTTDKTVSYAFRRKYSDRQAADITTRDHASYARIPKRQGLGGSDFVYAVTTGDPQGIGNTFRSAKDADETLKGEQFICQDVLKYAYMTFDGPSLVRNRSNQGKIVDILTRTMDGGLKALGYEIAFDLFRNGSGVRGRIASINGSVITLTDVRDVENFKRGMSLIASANANGSAPRAGRCKVKGLNRFGKQITVDDASQITGLQANDFLLRAGSAQNSIDGMGACTPIAAPTPGALFRGVERTNDLEALAGTRLDDPSRYPEEAIGDLAVQLSLMGRRAKRSALYPTDFQSVVKRLGAKVSYAVAGGDGKIGFQELTIYAGGYAIPITADQDVVPGEVRVWDDDAHELVYLENEIVHFVRDDGQIRRALTDDDGFWVHARFMGNYIQPDQAAHGVSPYQR